MEIVRTFQYNDSVNDHFEREPYSVLVRSREARRGQITPLLQGSIRQSLVPKWVGSGNETPVREQDKSGVYFEG